MLEFRPHGESHDPQDWITPKQALAIVALSQGDLANVVLLEHIRGGILPIWCARHSVADFGQDPEVADDGEPIPAGWWAVLEEENSFWNAATARFHFREIDGTRIIRCFGISVMKAQIERLFPPPIPIAAEAYTAQAEPSPLKRVAIPVAEPDIRKPVPPGALERWAKVFVGVHPDFKGDFAQRSAAAMFPDNSVSRDRVVKALTDIVGKRTRGRKKSDPQDK